MLSNNKNDSKKSSRSKEQTIATKTSTGKKSEEEPNKNVKEAQKVLPSKTSEEKELVRKPTISTRDSLKVKHVPSKIKSEKTSQNAPLPSKSRTHNNNSSSKLRPSQNKTISTKLNTPTASSSSTVKKTQYFPSKNLYSNALKSVEMQSKILKEGADIPNEKLVSKNFKSTEKGTPRSSVIKKSATMNTPKTVASMPKRVKHNLKDIPVIITDNKKTVCKDKESKNTPRDSSPETSSTLERPRTATLRKGSILNPNILLPEAPIFDEDLPAVTSKFLPQSDFLAGKNSPTSDDYDEDFDSYESDFEADSNTSSTEGTNVGNISGVTSSLSSSAGDISVQRDLSPLILHRNSNTRLSSAGTDTEKKLDSGTFELSDFKHRQILKHIENTMKKKDAILEQDHLKEKVGNHPSLSDEGFEDQKSLQFINFAVAKKKCEKRRASAARKKRGVELLSMIKLDAVSFTIFDSPSVPYDIFITNYGQGNSVQATVQTGEDNLSEEVQTDTITKYTKWTQMPSVFSTLDEKKENFWCQYRSEYIGSGDDVLLSDSKEKSSSDLNETRLATFLRHSAELVLKILSEEHMSKVDNLESSKNELPFSNGYLEFNTQAADILKNTSVLSLSIHPENASKVLSVHLNNEKRSDFINSIICVWDIGAIDAPRTILVSFGEVCCCTFSLDNDKYVLAGQKNGAISIWNIEEKCKSYDILSRTPSFITPIGSSHLSKVISVQAVQDQNRNNVIENTEICTLDEAGTLIIWSLYTNFTSIPNIVLINTQIIDLVDIYPQLLDLVCSDLIIMDNHAYVSTNYGFILHHLIRSNQSSIKMFVPETKIDATCLEGCPFSPSHFLAGYSNGDISLFSRTTKRPLLVLQNKEHIDTASVQLIRWSNAKPFLLYAKDVKNTIHIWDLCKSDMYPEYSIKFPENISSLKLSPVINVEREESAYMLIGTDNGKIYLHLLRKEYGHENVEKHKQHVKIFLDYVNRL